MIIVPKFSEYDESISEHFTPYLQGRYEIQLLSSDLSIAYVNMLKVLDKLAKYKKITDLVVHMPFKSHLIEYVIYSRYFDRQVIQLATRLGEYANRNQIRVKLLFHTALSKNSIAYKELVENVIELVDLFSNINITLLLENEIIDVSESDCTATYNLVSDLLLHGRHTEMCVDLCHIEATENIMNSTERIPESLIDSIAWIHFSSTLNNDGYIDKERTHGRVHQSLEDVKNDLNKLVDLGIDIDKTPLVTEISESDYIVRPDMLKELKMLNSIDQHNVLTE